MTHFGTINRVYLSNAKENKKSKKKSNQEMGKIKTRNGENRNKKWGLTERRRVRDLPITGPPPPCLSP
jgi:hypothetical protein